MKPLSEYPIIYARITSTYSSQFTVQGPFLVLSEKNEVLTIVNPGEIHAFKGWEVISEPKKKPTRRRGKPHRLRPPPLEFTLE